MLHKQDRATDEQSPQAQKETEKVKDWKDPNTHIKGLAEGHYGYKMQRLFNENSRSHYTKSRK
jgi:hypothetical protein